MNHLREAAQQALEALEKTHTQPGCEQWQAERKASVALRAALAQPEQEPVAKYSDIVSDGGMDPRNKFDHSPRREWQGLTEEEREQATDWSVEHIEAALKEKNQ